MTHAYHALALHEVRKPFRPNLWSCKRSYQKVAQVWFPGAHSDVGGGGESVSLSSEPLSWMLQKARRCGLEFNEAYLNKWLNPKPWENVSYPMSVKGFRRLFTSRIVLKTREIGKKFDKDGDRKRASLCEY